jgi:hypothetical protein
LILYSSSIGHDGDVVDSQRPLAIVDIDGVVADVRHRLHHLERRPKNWKAFFAAAAQDAIHPEGEAVVSTLAENHEIVFLTGRPGRLRSDTTAWLDANGLGGHRLVMRPEGDHRPAAVVKRELLDELATGRMVAVVVDDDPVVLDTMRAAGYAVYPAEWERRSITEEQSLRTAQEGDGET